MRSELKPTPALAGADERWLIFELELHGISPLQ